MCTNTHVYFEVLFDLTLSSHAAYFQITLFIVVYKTVYYMTWNLLLFFLWNIFFSFYLFYCCLITVVPISPHNSPPPYPPPPPTFNPPSHVGFVHGSFIHVPWQPFPFFPPLPSFSLPSGLCQFVLHFSVFGFILLICLFCWLGSTYRWDHMVFIFHPVAYFT